MDFKEIKTFLDNDSWKLLFYGLLFQLIAGVLTDYALINDLAYETNQFQEILHSRSIVDYYTMIFLGSFVYYILMFGFSIVVVEITKHCFDTKYDFVLLRKELFNGLLVLHVMVRLFDALHDILILISVVNII